MNKTILHTIALFTVISVWSCSPGPDANRLPNTLKAPKGFYHPISLKVNTDSHQCPNFTPFTQRLNFPSRYEGSDAKRDTINMQSSEIYREKTSEIYAFSRWVAEIADRLYSDQGSLVDYECVITQLSLWATQTALLNTANTTGKAVRKWTLAALSSNYLKLSHLHAQQADDKNERKRIEQWLSALAWQVKADYGDRPKKKVNNHDYWAAWAVIVTSVITQEKALFLWGKSIFDEAVTQISDDGFILSEMNRGKRAAHYQNFALAAIVSSAAFVNANQGLNNATLDRLDRAVSLTLQTLDTTAAFADITGEPQSNPEIAARGRLAWLPVYYSLRHSELICQVIQSYELTGNSRLGGDTFSLYIK